MAGITLHPWQHTMLKQMSNTRGKSLTGMMAVQHTGKSFWANMVKDLTMPDIKVLGSAKVDGKLWYTVQLSMPAREWLREQPVDDWYEHIDQKYFINRSMFDVSEQMYSALMLKWKQ